MTKMINTTFQCTECKNTLSNTGSCLECSRNFFNKDGFFDFTNNSKVLTDNTRDRLSGLLSNVYSHGYSIGIKKFLKNNSEFANRFKTMEGSIAFRAIHKNNKRCLVVNSDLGNIPHHISQSFDHVYSLDTSKEKILIQKSRFQKNHIDNIVLVRSDSKSLPFPDKYFDVVILDGIKVNEPDNGSSRFVIVEFLKEIRRVLATNGCLCVGLENKYGITIFQRKIENNSDRKSFTDSFFGYKSLFTSLGFQVSPYWALPSHKEPHFSARIEDDISLKWFFQNFDKKFFVDRRFRIAGIFLKLLNKTARKLILEFFCPSFLFYCYKEEKPQILEEMIMEKTGFKNLIQNPRRDRMNYILLDRYREPKKIVSCKFTKYDFTEKVIQIKRVFPMMRDPEEKIVMDRWIEGEPLDRLNVNDLKLTMKWLTNFQEKTKSEILSPQDIEEEVNNIKNELDSIKTMNGLPYDKWLDDYKEHLSNITLSKTAVHDDFTVRNILIDRKKSLVNVIDWDWRYQEKANPIYDFVWLATNIMMLSNNSVEEFRANCNGNGKVVKAVRIIQETMKKHFQVDFDFIKLQRFMILRFIILKIKDNTDEYLLYIELLKILFHKNHI